MKLSHYTRHVYVNQQGVAILPVVAVLSIFIIAIALGLAVFSLNESMNSAGTRNSSQALVYAKSGADDALERLAREKNYSCATTDCYSVDMVTNGCSTNNGCARVTVHTPGTFASAVDYAAGANTYGITSADFNEDGKKDIVVTNSGENTISIRLGTGSGAFGSQTNYNVAANPHDVVSADFNSDTHLDLAVSNSDANSVSILLGVGDGTFGAATAFTVGNRPEGIVAVDFNNDRDIDIVVAAYDAVSASVILGNGDGTFGAYANYATDNSPYYLTVADFNGDGNTDIASSNYAYFNNGTVSVLLGIGDGTFAADVVYPVAINPVGITSADFNNDGRIDIAAASYNSVNISVLMGNGDGTFQPRVNYTAGGAAVDQNFLSMGDFNQDGIVDLIELNYNSNTASILFGNGEGGFGSATSYSVGATPNAIIVDDFNNDGKVDFAVTSDSDDNFSVLLAQPDIIAKGQVKNNIRQIQVNLTRDPSGSGQIIRTHLQEIN